MVKLKSFNTVFMTANMIHKIDFLHCRCRLQSTSMYYISMVSNRTWEIRSVNWL